MYFLILHNITETRLFKYIENFTSKNWKKKIDEKLWYFFIFLLKTYIVGTRYSARRF